MGADVGDLEGLAQRLETASARVGVEGRKAITEQADATRDAQKAHAPVRSGDLRDHIRVLLDGDGRSGAMWAEIGPQGEARGHGYFQEHGTARHPAQPFVEPASQQADKEWPARVEKLMEAVTDDL